MFNVALSYAFKRPLSHCGMQIKELKQAWNQDQDDDAQHDHGVNIPLSHSVDGSSLLFNQAKPLERIEILSSLPPRARMDSLISCFFNRKDFPITMPRESPQA